MASPSACGGCACAARRWKSLTLVCSLTLVLSALKAEGISWTPSSVKKAMKATAKSIDDPLGVGFLQVDKLHALLVEQHALATGRPVDLDAEFVIKITPHGRSEPMRGIYLRSADECASLQSFQVEVVPKFFKASWLRPTSVFSRRTVAVVARSDVPLQSANESRRTAKWRERMSSTSS